MKYSPRQTPCWEKETDNGCHYAALKGSAGAASNSGSMREIVCAEEDENIGPCCGQAELVWVGVVDGLI